MSDTAKSNTAETMRKVMEEIGLHTPITDTNNPITSATLISMPSNRKVQDVTAELRAAAEYLQPTRRKGKATLGDLQSLIDWTNRFKGETSALFANNNRDNPSLTCIADYHAEGPADPTNENGDPSARHCHHQATYHFPLSDEWKAWIANSGQWVTKDEMGEFIEANAKDVMDPTPAIISMEKSDKHQDFENRLIETGRQIEGRFGQLHSLLVMSRQFQIYETSNLEVSSNRDTGEQSIQFLNEHRDKDGAPLKIPNLIIIAIPVFTGGAPYRMPVRFQYRKMSGTIKFSLSVYNPEKAFDAAFDEALEKARDQTKLPLFLGTPEA